MLNKATTEEVTAESLIADGIISKANDGIVILATGTLDKKLTVKAVRFTKKAKETIEALGGKTEVIQLFKTLKNALKTPDVRKKLMYTLILIVVFRLGCYITVPGVDSFQLAEAFSGQGLGSLIELISGVSFTI